MKSAKYNYILLFITITILATIGLQIFWNLKNYRENRVQLVKEVQSAFDNGIEYYYVEDSKNDFIAFVDASDTIPNEDFIKNLTRDTLFKNNMKRLRNHTLPKPLRTQAKADTSYAISLSFTADPAELDEFDIPRRIQDTINWESKRNNFGDSANKSESQIEVHGDVSKISSVRVLKGKKATDSIANIKELTNKIIISMFQDSITYEKLSKSVDKELARRNIRIDYDLEHFKEDTIFNQFPEENRKQYPLSAISNSSYLPANQKLQISFSDPTLLLLERSMTEILLSLLLSLSIIFCLLYLLQTINRQKKVDEIKNDLISNITHEFKTPITTIASALEGIRNFNADDDKEKTNRYLSISGLQLKKLELMVEKLLETASLDTDQLVLQREAVDMVKLLAEISEKFQLLYPQKTMVFDSALPMLIFRADLFHFENALSNLIDNAVKYGGNLIRVTLEQQNNLAIITVKDNGEGIEKSQKDKIFDKFYRVPKGNVHDVKGFGIGLYYAKKIVEKHGGKLELLPDAETTTFKITLPYVG